MMDCQVFGIRHHGPGSARALLEALDNFAPDVVLVEGPPDAQELLPFLDNLQPPVAMLVYDKEQPSQAAFYPFAVFSPEWQCMIWAKKRGKQLIFMDLPIYHRLAILPTSAPENAKHTEHPLDMLAKLAGYDDQEQWWNALFEQTMRFDAYFQAVSLLMHESRQIAPPEDDMTLLREAYMRQTIRTVAKTHPKIAIVCGAWHLPALDDLSKYPAKDDLALLKGLKKVPTQATWIPWTNKRLAFSSNYGAGILSPGWYVHLWENPEDMGEIWLSKVGRTLRKAGKDISSAHIIDAVRLSKTLAALRQKTRAGLEEFDQAATAVFAHGDQELMHFVSEQVYLNDQIGQVSQTNLNIPLVKDIEQQNKKLKLKFLEEEKTLELDLRESLQLQKSCYFHRLHLLEIPWVSPQNIYTGKGNFKERWTQVWSPEMMIKVIEMAIWGNTVELAANNFLIEQINQATKLSQIRHIIGRIIPAELVQAVEILLEKLANLAAITEDIVEMIETLPALVQAFRYGNVRNTDKNLLSSLIDQLLTRIFIGFTPALVNLEHEQAEQIAAQINKFRQAIGLLDSQEWAEKWEQTLLLAFQHAQIAPYLAGYITRILLDQNSISSEQAAQTLSFQLSQGQSFEHCAHWISGLLKGSAMLLIVDDQLWSLVHHWVSKLADDEFELILPLLRKTFAQFSKSERRQIGQKAKRMVAPEDSQAQRVIQAPTEIDTQRATLILPWLSKIYGGDE